MLHFCKENYCVLIWQFQISHRGKRLSRRYILWSIQLVMTLKSIMQLKHIRNVVLNWQLVIVSFQDDLRIIWQFYLFRLKMFFHVTVCIKSCIGRADGDYQSCYTCDGYILCSNGNTINIPCAPSFPGRPLHWDNIKEKCVYNSSTCDPTYILDVWKLHPYFAQVLVCKNFFS